MNIKDCKFIGVKWNKAAVGCIEAIATGLAWNAIAIVENARALGNLATVLKASNVNIETMLRVPAVIPENAELKPKKGLKERLDKIKK